MCKLLREQPEESESTKIIKASQYVNVVGRVILGIIVISLFIFVVGRGHKAYLCLSLI